MSLPGLDYQTIVQASVQLADENGVAAVTMRRLAQHLGVGTMSPYHYVPNKDALLVAMVDEVFGEIEMIDSGGWRASMERRCRSARTTLSRHRWAVGLMDSLPNPGPKQLDHHEALLGCLRKGGFSVAAAGRAFAVLDSFVYGFALQELNLPFDSPESAESLTAELIAKMPRDRYPNLIELAETQVLSGTYEFSQQFDAGLELILDGLERLRAAERTV